MLIDRIYSNFGFFYICLMLYFGWFWFMILPLESSSKETDDSTMWRQPVQSPGLGSLGEGWPGVGYISASANSIPVSRLLASLHVDLKNVTCK